MRNAFFGGAVVVTCAAAIGWTARARAQTASVTTATNGGTVASTAAVPVGMTQQRAVAPAAVTSTTNAQVYATTPVVPAETTTVWSPNRAMLSTGVLFFVGPYVAGVIVAAYSTHSGDNQLYLPVVGPWLDLAHRDCAGEGNCGGTETGYKVLLGFSGAFQALGVLEIIGAFVFPEVRQVTTVPATAYTPEMTITPMRLGEGYGLGAVARF